ncbi:hypothetical protein WH47_03900 [Habropoda laboriosa]|uniref:Uncharacterized protein n=1 Tax=Habropoda laboriosa TaxID=597456 RepID=A0A0L7QJ15_9HYME|nr:hypothetical protein WH47_01224 [Habropoda laboriosa]KOC58643.1 hypothetical protein WH47_03900 [Habropoda laboriosa]
MKRDEHVLDFISRTKDIRDAIIDCDRRSPNISDIDTLTADCFIRGVIPQIRTELRHLRGSPLTRVFNEAIEIFKELENDNKRYGRTPETKHVQFSPRDKTPERREERRVYTPPPFRDTWRSSSPRRYYRDEPRPMKPEPPRRPYQPPYRSTYEPPRREYREPQHDNNRQNVPPRHCTYCQIPGHDIHECRKRARNLNRQPGNDRDLPPRLNRGPEVKPVQVQEIKTEEPGSSAST